MRVERGEHPVDRAVDQHVVGHRLDIAGLDALVDREQLAEFGACLAIDLRETGGRRGDERDGGHEGGGTGQFGNLHQTKSLQAATIL